MLLHLSPPRRKKKIMRAIVLAVALIAYAAPVASAGWGDWPLCASSIRESRAATRDFYTYYGKLDALTAEALLRLRAARQLVEPPQAACRGTREQIALAFHARELAQIEADIRMRPEIVRARPETGAVSLSPVVSPR